MAQGYSYSYPPNAYYPPITQSTSSFPMNPGEQAVPLGSNFQGSAPFAQAASSSQSSSHQHSYAQPMLDSRQWQMNQSIPFAHPAANSNVSYMHTTNRGLPIIRDAHSSTLASVSASSSELPLPSPAIHTDRAASPVLENKADDKAKSSSQTKPKKSSNPKSKLVQVKQEVIEGTLGLPDTRSKSSRWQDIPGRLRAVLLDRCQGHAVPPSIESRRSWAKANNIPAPRVHTTIRSIFSSAFKNAKGLSKEDWELPYNEVIEDDGIVKVQSVETKQSKVIPDGGCSNVNAAASTSVQKLETFTSLPAHLPPTVSTDSSSSTAVSNPAVSPPSASTSESGPSTEEFVDFLTQSNFFKLVTGPHAIKSEDMFDWPAFEGKLKLHQCTLDPLLVWRTLKTFYFFL